MSTVVRRIVRSTPERDAVNTWNVIVELLTPFGDCPARKELTCVIGIAASLIAEQAPKNHPIVVTCDGPRTRVYCLYDDEAIEGSDASEGPLGYDPLQGDWRVSLPCHEDELDWVQGALKQHSERITVRELDAVVAADSEETAKAAQTLTLDPRGFLEP
jgi:hypothetical protein